MNMCVNVPPLDTVYRLNGVLTPCCQWTPSGSGTGLQSKRHPVHLRLFLVGFHGCSPELKVDNQK